MSTALMTERIPGTSPRLQARMAGVIAWITTTAGFAAVVRGRLVIFDDAAATAHNILSHQLLFGWLSQPTSSRFYISSTHFSCTTCLNR
jgi:hypothetical protein